MIDDDDELRARLGAIADEGAPRLDERARERVLATVEREGPALVRGPRVRWIGAAVVLAEAAAALLLVAFRETGPTASGPAW